MGGALARPEPTADDVVEFAANTMPTRLHDADWTTPADARTVVAEYLEIFNNTQRPHSALDYLPPLRSNGNTRRT